MPIPKFKQFNIEPYKPGKSEIKKIKNVLKLSANESALGASSRVKKILSSKNLELSRYPDSKSIALRKQIAKTYNCNFNKIICGAGSDEVIQMICSLYLSNNDEVIVPEFSFLMYRIYAEIVGAKVVFAKEDKFRVSILEILKRVTKKTKIVFIANPNNPTGTYLTKSELISLRNKLNQNILLVIDDAYHEYMTSSDYISALNLFKNKENVFILRTFSKIYGLASLRVGWGYGSIKIINALNSIKPPFNVSQIAQAAAIEALKDKKFNLINGKKIKKFLEQYQIYSNNINTNFLLLSFKKCKISAKQFYEKLKQKGIIIRSTEEGYKIKNHLRLSIGSQKENLSFLESVKDIFR